ncbi:hypothetical protein C4D60_Mb11t20920 [Musa balbisiana]|uniref:Transmembrane protein n=1 Tax=Musa balbisiana TaxID=52838 RepID=A0A4S8J5Q0_MUSBA|nr:hypothetical protein C4D60_Mb11t20920 [Musa balbisiana]
MQRQSLGSPGASGGAGKEEKRRSISGAAGTAVAAPPEKPEAAFDADKLIRTSTRADRSIHLIPVFTILCLVVLYFFSHEPTHAGRLPPDLQTFSGPALRFDTRDAVSGTETGSVTSAAIHESHRGMKASAAARRLRHRKLKST